MPGHEEQFPSGVLVYVGQSQNGGGTFVVRPTENRRNRWYWRDPTTPLRAATWARTLKSLPSEGFYTLPESIEFEGGGRWVKNAIVELGYNDKAQGILFVAEWREDGNENALYFSEKGLLVNDQLLERLTWAPILPARTSAGTTTTTA
ncbi:MAG TPA: hypothetical protein VER33_02025 [Polyangiaceae bacterium]|nr:hypothetical protein [Polyangiaceae bacterium]